MGEGFENAGFETVAFLIGGADVIFIILILCTFYLIYKVIYKFVKHQVLRKKLKAYNLGMLIEM